MQITTFKHCNPSKNIFCFKLPTKCPICDEPIKSCLVPPCFVPSPLNCKDGAKPYSVVIKPTHGSFIRYGTERASILVYKYQLKSCSDIHSFLDGYLFSKAKC